MVFHPNLALPLVISLSNATVACILVAYQALKRDLLRDHLLSYFTLEKTESLMLSD